MTGGSSARLPLPLARLHVAARKSAALIVALEGGMPTTAALSSTRSSIQTSKQRCVSHTVTSDEKEPTAAHMNRERCALLAVTCGCGAVLL